MSEGEIVRTSKEVREDNKMLRFQVGVLWRDLKDYRTRLDHTLHSSRESSRIKQGIIDELKAEISRREECANREAEMRRMGPEPDPPPMSMYEKCHSYRCAGEQAINLLRRVVSPFIDYGLINEIREFLEKLE